MEQFFSEVVLGKKSGLLYDLLRAILWLFSGVYCAIIVLRRLLYRWGIFRSYHPHTKTIVVGNIVAGGTGKTPFTIFLAKQLASCALLVRGYEDEVALMRRHLPGVSLFIGKDRKKSAMAAEKEHTHLLLDDGLQHLAIVPDVRIAMVDAICPFGGGNFLPRGLLRDSPSRLKQVDLVVLHRVDCVDNASAIQKEIEKYTCAPVVHSQFSFDGLYSQSGNSIVLEKGSKLALFCSIARPEAFRKLVAKEGFEVIAILCGKDHVGLSNTQLENFSQRASQIGATALICTEKDIVRLPQATSLALPLYWVKGKIEIVSGREYIDRLIYK